MITFVMVVIGRCWDPAVLGRNFVALGGVTLVLAAGLAAYGVNSAFGRFSFDAKKNRLTPSIH